MKRLFKIVISLCVMSICFGLNTSAQTITKNTLPKNLKEAQMNFQMDFSKAMILGMSESEFAEYEKDWYDDKPTIIHNFVVGANLALGKSYRFGDYKNARYAVKVLVNTITEEGFFICEVDIVDEKNEVVFHLDSLTGGSEPAIGIGTKLARMKVWATLTGKKLGSILKNEFSSNR